MGIDEMKNKISIALKDPVLQIGFEIICKNLSELEKACDETQELLDKQIEATYKVVEENNELKAKYDTCLRENTGLKIHNAYVEKKLAEAKDIIRELLNFDIFPDVGIKRQAEQFLSEVE